MTHPTPLAVLAILVPSVLPSLALLQACSAQDTFLAEVGILERHVQLTTIDRFVKAGESYFSPDDSKIIFQAIEVPPPGAEPEPFYQMYVADLVFDTGRRVTGIENLTQLSPSGSSNTCGWFHPTKPDTVIFCSTLVPPTDPSKSGYQREGSRYRWQFPKEMTIVECNLTRADGTAATLKVIVEDPEAYLAECAFSADGRHLIFCKRTIADDVVGGDLLIMDMQTGRTVTVAGHDGYDGGPFFSPDGKRICYRSDRAGNDLLQVFVGELAYGEDGGVTGLAREFQLTDNEHVNWAPFWHPDGRHLIYATSEEGHHNYEVFIIDADSGALPTSPGPTKYGTSRRRLTNAAGFDGLPVFNADGTLMMWTGQRDEGGTSQLWLADFVMDLDP